MFVELVYDKRNVAGLPGAKDIILNELTKRVHHIFPDAEVRVKPMRLNRMLEEMFEESDFWMVAE